ncbi:uncharacterized protein C6orf118 isoform X3 [Cynoglossus semilaevis]|uniref:Chromosome 12 C6orf118 homolog n=1 Tax=Cynoglossus semilaevis TaxID=244447 RepID=A0A3P8W2N7_CYNSE|nr:uncharacterized protein C6orf118 homolog isoform X3 [Cynoglossus semilaevis]
MFSNSRSKPESFRSDVHKLLQAAEAGQKADILTYLSGHLGPRTLNKSQSYVDTKQSLWTNSQRQGATANHQTVRLKQTKTLTHTESRCAEFTSRTVSVSRPVQAPDPSSHADRRQDISLPYIIRHSSGNVSVQMNAISQKKPNSLSNPEGKQQFDSSVSDQKGMNNEDQLKTKQWFGRQHVAKQKLWAGINVAEMLERKLQKGLKKLSAQSWPSTDRLAVFSDVFDDVCEHSPVFGRILREIKTDYDLYIHRLTAPQSPAPDGMLEASLEEFGDSTVTSVELKNAEKEIFRLELEASRALKENKQLKEELQNLSITDSVETDFSMLQDSETFNRDSNSVWLKRRQVLEVWMEIQELEQDLKEKLVSTVTTTATEKHVKDLKKETMRLIVSNDRLKSNNQNLENKINMVLNREKSSQAIQR